jgi:hypothetical protein
MRVINVEDDVLDLVKKHCKEKGLIMYVWASKIIREKIKEEQDADLQDNKSSK